MKLKDIRFLIFLFLFALPAFVFADNTGDKKDFYVEKGYSLNDKAQVSATLIKSPDRLHFYFENGWWNSRTEKQKEEIGSILESLGAEFNSKIYPTLTSTFGKESTPGVDNDSRITVLFYPTKSSVKGYVRNIDEYEKTINPYSNQREMVYINADLITGSFMKEILAHEFMHLITISQKEMRIGVPEEIWLNEAYSEYAVTLLGYNDKEDSYLKNRMETFIERPYDSLVSWSNAQYDYGVVNAFVHYLVDRYGIDVLVDSLKSDDIGIGGVADALSKNGAKESFSQIFTDWTIASYVNDCSLGANYCYKNKNLKDVHIIPFGNYLPFSGESTLYLGQTMSNYSANWQKFSGGKGDLRIKISNPSGADMAVPYIVKSVSGATSIGAIKLNGREGELVVSGMGKDVYSVIVIPSVRNGGVSGSEYFYSITANIVNGDVQPETDNNITLPFSVEKPLSQMNKEELLMVLIKLIIYLLGQGKLHI